MLILTGDYKIDQTPADGRPFDWMRFGEYGQEGVLALLADSTNADQSGWTPSERTVRDRLEELVRTAPARVFLSTFSSHAHRVQQVVEIAKRHNRKVAFVGRSLTKNVRVLRELGELDLDAKQELSPKELMRLPLRNQLFVTTGCQGEPLAALSRIALGDDRNVECAEGDRVILSAKIIPGNERRMSLLISHFYRRKVEVITVKKHPDIHVSGHPSREEMKALLNLVHPRYLVPIHGEYRLLAEHAELGRMVGIPSSNCIVIEDGQSVLFHDGKARLGEKIPTGRVLIDEGSLDQVEEIVIRDRQHISEDGIVVPVTALNAHSGEVEVEIITRGLVWVEGEEALIQRARDLVLEIIDEMTEEELGDAAVVKTQVRRVLRKFFRKEVGKGPMIIPVVMEV